MAAILAPVSVPAAAVDSTAAAAAGAVAGGATGVEGAADVETVCSGRKNEVIGRPCTAAVEAVVEGAKVLAAAFYSPATFMMLEVSIRGLSPYSEGACCVLSPRKYCITPVIGGEAPWMYSA